MGVAPVTIDGTYSFERPGIDHHIGQSVEIMHRSTVAYLWALNPQCFGLTVDSLGHSTLAVNAFVLLGLPIQSNAQFAARRDVDVFDTAHAFGKLLMVAALPARVRPE